MKNSLNKITPGMIPPFPTQIFNRTPCPRVDCDGHTKWNDAKGGGYYFTCTSRACDFDTRGQKVPYFILPEWLQPKKMKVKPVIDPPGYLKAFRAEIQRRTEILMIERAKFPPTLLKKGKKWVSNPKFTSEMSAHMHKFAFTHEQVRGEVLKNGGK